MKGIYTIHKRIYQELNENTRSLYPEQVDIAVNTAVRMLIAELLGYKPEEYQPGRPLAVKGGYGLTRTNNVFLQQLMVDIPFSTNPLDASYGTIDNNTNPATLTYPTFTEDFPILFLIRGLTSTFNNIEFINDAELGFRLNSALLPININNPVIEIGNRLCVYPNTLDNFTLKVIQAPPLAKYAYTVPEPSNGYEFSNGEYVYDDENSVDVPFGPLSYNRIADLALIKLSLSVDNFTVLNTTQNLK
jgi:hypothetical protein